MKLNLNDARSNNDAQRTIYLIEEQHNPSTDFFIIPALAANKYKGIVRCGFNELPNAADLIGVTIIFVRYIAPAWVRLIEKVRDSLQALIIFIDDDVFTINASAGMSWRYRFKLAYLSAWRFNWLKQQRAELWVSTPYLCQKYAEWRPRLVLPSPVSSPCHVLRVFYHGTASHNAEIRWLRPVIAEVLRRNTNIAFEIVGGDDVYRLYRGLDRVTVIHPMKWSAYQCFLNAEKRHIGLAPLLDTPFNRARSYAKFFGIHSCGAVGIYSENGVFNEIVRHGIDAFVITMEPEAWVNAIVQLVEDNLLRETLFANACITFTELVNKAQVSYSDLLS